MAKRKEPCEKNGAAVLETVALKDIDTSDRSFQLRLTSHPERLLESMRTCGQLDPVKVMVGKCGRYVIIDGFTRVEGAIKLGWKSVRALVYEAMSDREATSLSWRSNVERKNLTHAEKANAMKLALDQGFNHAEVGEFFGVSRRTVERYLELPEAIMEIVDGKSVTMAHGKLLNGGCKEMSKEDLGKVASWMRQAKRTVAELRKHLKSLGFMSKRGTEKRSVACITAKRVQIYRSDIRPNTPAATRARIAAELRKAADQIENMRAGAIESQPATVATA